MRCENPFYMSGGKTFINAATFNQLAPDLRLNFMPFPCGRCTQCRIMRARYWTARVILESTQYLENAFVTLTYNDESCPPGGSLYKKDLQLFFRHVRKRIRSKFRYFAVGEYGHEGKRHYNPHYHVILFGIPWFEEKKIDQCWSFEGVSLGHTFSGEVNAASIRYCCEYCVKKWDKLNDRKPSFLTPEFMASSRRNPGGIGTVALPEIAARLRASFKLKPNDLYPGIPPVRLRFNGKIWPLDRYMRSKLYELLKIDPEVKAHFLHEYQNRIFMDNKPDDTEEGGWFDLNKLVRAKNKEIGKIWTRKYQKRLKHRLL